MMRPAVMKAFSRNHAVRSHLVAGACRGRILASPGGQVGPFLDLFERVRASGERVVIDGPCLSACTLVLSMVPGDRICVTRKAILDFTRRGRSTRAAGCTPSRKHPNCAGGLSGRSPGLDSPPRRLELALLLLRGRELTAIYPACR